MGSATGRPGGEAVTTLRVRLAITFALVALLTGLAVVITAPTIIGRGFASLEGDVPAGSGQGPGAGQGRGPMAGLHAQQIQQDTTRTIILVALLAAAGASVVGFVIAGRIAAPLRRLEQAAGAVAGGDLARRSGLADRGDEIGALGRSFDTMAGELEAAEATRRRFFQDAAHELKTPLAVVEATAAAVLEGVYEHDDRHLETIRAQSRILARIVDDLRTVSLAESGALPLRLEGLPVADAVHAAVQGFSARAELAGVRLEQAAPAGLVVLADRDRLAQVLGALLDNAIRHTPSGGAVGIAASTDVVDAGRVVRIVVSDTGPGLVADEAAHVFDRFYQADPARDRTSGTSGLGLSIVRALVEAQGGTVGVETTPGVGARFWIRLPAPASVPPG